MSQQPPPLPLTTRRPERFRGERAVTIIMTALLLVPLMVFAAFGVDLAGFYSRVGQLQRAADAAALAGTVWMPDFTKATEVAAQSLARNGFVHGADGIEVGYAPGKLPNSLAVTIEDTSVTTYFSDVIGHRQAIARSAEAQYNLPLPLGSPLNYFGGDSTRTAPAPVTTHAVDWPADFETRVPDNHPCNVGTAANQNLGRWAGNPPTYRRSEFSGTLRCGWRPTPTLTDGSTPVPPPDYMHRQPTNAGGSGCRVRTNGNSNPTLGRWQGSSFSTGTGGTGSLPACTWQNASTNPASLPPAPETTRPQAWPCRVGYETSRGWWDSSGTYSTASVPSGNNQTAGNILCRWTAEIRQVDVTPPNPISPTRSPGFWAMIEGPQTVSPNGDAYNTRCYIDNDCSSVQNLQYKPESDPNRGFWYIVRAPSTPLSRIQINVFDASYNPSGDIDELAGDRSLGDRNVFPTRFRVFAQPNPLDFEDRQALGHSSPNQTAGSCHWELGSQAPFRGAWQELCTIDNPTPGGLYQVNVQTRGASGNGVNGYAIEAVSCRTDGACFGSAAIDQTTAQPALFAYSSMGMQNNNTCSGSGCTPPPATFYLAEVGPQYAGKSLIIELWDPGDATGNASLFPKAPSAVAPKPVRDIPASDCSYTSRVLPNARQSSSAGGPTGRIEAAPRSSDFSGRCGIRTTVSGSRQFNGVWLTIRVEIPRDYTCNESTASNPVNPETDPNSCWWGIEYSFSSSASDVTTWQARIEGNPVHLTE